MTVSDGVRGKAPLEKDSTSACEDYTKKSAARSAWAGKVTCVADGEGAAVSYYFADLRNALCDVCSSCEAPMADLRPRACVSEL